MIGRILESARSVFLTRGYDGATVDEIARTAEISRASVYTYFPTKRDILLALGAEAAEEAEQIVLDLWHDADGKPVTTARLRRFVESYFDYLDRHGAFATAWTQAALEDEQIRNAGVRRHVRLCELLGGALGGVAPEVNPGARGLAAYALVERAWSLSDFYAVGVEFEDLVDEVTRMLFTTAVYRAKS